MQVKTTASNLSKTNFNFSYIKDLNAISSEMADSKHTYNKPEIDIFEKLSVEKLVKLNLNIDSKILLYMK